MRLCRHFARALLDQNRQHPLKTGCFIYRLMRRSANVVVDRVKLGHALKSYRKGCHNCTFITSPSLKYFSLAPDFVYICSGLSPNIHLLEVLTFSWGSFALSQVVMALTASIFPMVNAFIILIIVTSICAFARNCTIDYAASPFQRRYDTLW